MKDTLEFFQFMPVDLRTESCRIILQIIPSVLFHPHLFFYNKYRQYLPEAAGLKLITGEEKGAFLYVVM